LKQIIPKIIDKLWHAETTPGKPFVITGDSVRLYVKKVISKKPVCIFVHGGPGAWSLSFENLNGNKFESIFSMVYYDQRGCGRSASANDYSLLRMAMDIEDIRNSVHAARIYLMAHSFGGIIAEKYAEVFPEHVQGLVFLNCTLDIYNSIENQINYMNQLSGRNFKVKDQAELMTVFVSVKNAVDGLGLTYKILADNKATNDSLGEIDKTNPGNSSFAKAVWGLPEYFQDFSIKTGQINVAVLVVTGLNDHAIGPDHYKKFHFPGQKVRIINGGHLLYYENTNEVLEAVWNWIQN
jgi:proline iminopeptidase